METPTTGQTPEQREALRGEQAKRSSLRRLARAGSLFCRIVWRRWEDPQPGYPAHYACTYRLTIRDAARIAWNVHRSNVEVRDGETGPRTTKETDE